MWPPPRESGNMSGAQAGESSAAAAGALHAVVGYGGARHPIARSRSTIRGMADRMLLTLVLVLALGGNLLAQEPGDPDYEPNPDTVDAYESLGEEAGSDYELDGDAFDEAADQAGLNAPQVVPPTGSEIDEFRAGLEAHWGGNLPALLAYLNSIDPTGGDNPEPPGEGASAHWEPDDDYDEFGILIESAEEERERWRARVEQKLRQLSQSY